jgi:hypothetical protein
MREPGRASVATSSDAGTTQTMQRSRSAGAEASRFERRWNQAPGTPVAMLAFMTVTFLLLVAFALAMFDSKSP